MYRCKVFNALKIAKVSKSNIERDLKDRPPDILDILNSDSENDDENTNIMLSNDNPQRKVTFSNEIVD